MTPRTLFRLFAFAEAVTWAGLIAAMILRGAGVTDDLVRPTGGVHGFVFLGYCVVTVFVWVNERWRPLTGLLGLASAVIPFATIPFELVADHRGLLSRQWRLGAGGEQPNGFFEHVQTWVLRHAVLAIVLLAVAVTVVFLVLLRLGPPTLPGS